MRELQDFPVIATLFSVQSHIVGAAMLQSFFDLVADVILCPAPLSPTPVRQMP
jgi:hypothetical protein